ncbi:ATP-binding protein, partial [bacterium]|nr:ATP-binding protein [bacterium]
MKVLEEKGEVLASEIIKTAGFSRTYVNRFFQELRDEGKIVLIGKANRARYVLASREAVMNAKKEICDTAYILQNQDLAEDKVLADIKKKTGILIGIHENVSDILDYAFSEMLNNAIEHSGSKTIKVAMQKDKDSISFSVVDKGIGIFKNIMKKKKLRNTMEAIEDLLKGKQTTAPAMHSGEGIFFTSKVADMLVIQGSRKKLLFNNILD